MRNPRWFRQTATGPAPRAARQRLHDRLLAQWRAHAPDVATDRRALLLAGPPGAGKSTIRSNLTDRIGIPLERWRIINSDDFKDLILHAALQDGTYDQFVPAELAELERTGERFWPRELAAIVHDEAAILVERAVSDSTARGENIIIDGTLANAENASRLTDRLYHARYTIQIASVDGPHDVIAQRITQRWRTDYLAAEHGTAQGAAAQLGGRWVPSEIPNQLYDHGNDESRCATIARRLARDHPAIADHYAYRVQTADTAPQLIAHSGRGRAGGALLTGEQLTAIRLSQATRTTRRRRGPPGR
jgi:predicted kinase